MLSKPSDLCSVGSDHGDIRRSKSGFAKCIHLFEHQLAFLRVSLAHTIRFDLFLPACARGVDECQRVVIHQFAAEARQIRQNMSPHGFIGNQRISIKVLGRKCHDVFVHAILHGQLSSDIVAIMVDQPFHHADRKALLPGFVGKYRRRQLQMVAGQNQPIRLF